MSNPQWSIPPEPGPPVQQAPRPRANLEIAPGSRLEQLRAHHTDLVARAAEVKQQLDAVIAAIKREAIAAAAPGTEYIGIPAGPDGPELVVVWSRRRRFDTKQFHQDQPALYEQYRIPDPRWELRPVKGGGGG